MATITEIIPSLGSVPTTADPSTFDERGDTLLGTALPAFRTSVNTLATQANALAAGLNSIAAGGAMTIPYTFSTTTTDSDPGAGILRLDNATQNATTTIRADLSGSDASVWTDVLNTFDDSTSTIKGHILLQATGDATKWLLFSVSALASPSGYKNITVANVGSSAASPFANGDALVLKFSRNGDKGDIGPAGGISTVASITTSTTLTSASAGYQYTAMTAMAQSVTLPDATTMSVGSPKFYLDNSAGGYPVGIRNTSGTLLMAIAAGGTAFVSCESISTAAGVWSITGTNLEPGLITIDSTLSSTYVMSGQATSKFVVLDSSKTIHFTVLTSGLAAFCVDNTTGAVGTPVTVSATANMVPRTAFMITSTTAIVFYSSSTETLISVVLSVSGATTLAVGTPSSTLTATDCGSEDFYTAPKIAQLDSTLYLVSYPNASTASVAAFQVSAGTTVTLGAVADIITVDSVASSSTTYALTTTTAAVLYKSSTSGNPPHANNCAVISVTNANPPVCTVGTKAALTGVSSTTTGAPSSCKLSATKIIVLDNNNVAGSAIASVFTISGTSVSSGTLVSVETGTSQNHDYASSSATRYNPHLFPLSTTTALLWYASDGISRAVVLTEAAGVVTKGAITYGNISRAGSAQGGYGAIQPQGTTEFCSIMNGLAFTEGGHGRVVVSKINGTTITQGASSILGGAADFIEPQINTTRLSSGKYVITTVNGLTVPEYPVFSTNGDSINFMGSISAPPIINAAYVTHAVSSNRLVLVGSITIGTTAGASTANIRILNIEVAA